MEDNSSLTLMKAIGDMKAELKQDIGDLKKDVAQGITVAVGTAEAAKTAHLTLRNELLGDGGRLKSIEEDITFKTRIGVIFSILIVPIIAALHQIGVALHWIH
jgi:hypothetical protein